MIPAQLHLTLPLWLRDKMDESRLYADDDAKVAVAIELAPVLVPGSPPVAPEWVEVAAGGGGG